MELKIIGTGSKGNCYTLGNQREQLLIECGLPIKTIKKALNHNFDNIVGCLVTHRHNDHAKSVKEVLDLGVDVYSILDVFVATGTTQHHRARNLISNVKYKIGGFSIIPFAVQHDVPCYGYLIDHADTGRVLFLTDTYYCKYFFICSYSDKKPRLKNSVFFVAWLLCF